MIFELCALFLLAFWLWDRKKTVRARAMIAKFPGPKTLPFVGFFRTVGRTSVDFHKWRTNVNNLYGKGGSPFRVPFGKRTIIVLSHPNDFEMILSSQNHIEKGYRSLVPWLGTGLLTSTGSKWRSRRKILTPAFHFNILEDCLETFNANAKVLVGKLRTQVNCPAFDIYKYINFYTLDNISETAMGVKMNAQIDNQTEYVRAVRSMTSITVQRAMKPWLSVEFLFNMTRLKRIQDQTIRILHKATNSVIKAKRAALANAPSQGVTTEKDHGAGTKKRLAFLDILMEAAAEGSGMTDEDIREEVDTFMFGGHDTTSSALSFVLWLLSWHQDIQNKVFLELAAVVSRPSGQCVSMRELSELTYLKQVVKETLRLYPIAPEIARVIGEDVTLSGGLVIPGGTGVCLSIISCHKNPAFWPDPLKFDPERFSSENVRGRHPYAYVPFSAGPRNCVGQKFAMLEIMLTLCEVLRAFKVLPGSQKPDLELTTEVTLLGVNGVPVKLQERVWENVQC